jgi:acetyltransferase-like isoleucine patch superfamily enzyme
MQKDKKLIIFGTGEIGELACFYFENDSEYQVVGFTADDQYISEDKFLNRPLVPFSELYFAAKNLGYELVSYVCSKSAFWHDLSIGENCFILENQTIQPTVKIGANVMIWSGNHIGHGTRIDDHTYISSHVCISGHTKIGTHCFFGVNSATRDFISIGNGVFIAMGASVTSDVEDGSVVLGAKGNVFPPDSKMAQRLKKKYFRL